MHIVHIGKIELNPILLAIENTDTLDIGRLQINNWLQWCAENKILTNTKYALLFERIYLDQSAILKVQPAAPPKNQSKHQNEKQIILN